MKKLEVKIDGKWKEVLNKFYLKDGTGFVEWIIQDIRIVEQKTKRERLAELLTTEFTNRPVQSALDLAGKIIDELGIEE